MFAAQVPSITLNSPNLGEFPRVFLDDDRTYSDYMLSQISGSLTEFGKNVRKLNLAILTHNEVDSLRIADYIGTLKFR